MSDTDIWYTVRRKANSFIVLDEARGTTAHEPLQDITLLVSNIKLSCGLHMLQVTTTTPARLQPRQLRSRKQSSGTILNLSFALLRKNEQNALKY
jgi:hypothetical protein